MPSSDHDANPLAIRRLVYYSGNVQGVGFRYTVCQIAKDFRVVGTVKNLLDGRVEIVAEGWPEEVDRLIAAIEEAMNNYIEYSTATDSTALDTFTDFGIEY